MLNESKFGEMNKSIFRFIIRPSITKRGMENDLGS